MTTDIRDSMQVRRLFTLYRRVRELAKQSTLLRGAVLQAREGLFSKRTAKLRRELLGEIRYRRLEPADESALLSFAKGRIFIPPAFLINGLHHRWRGVGMAVGAFDRHERLRGFACLDTYDFDGIGVEGWWIRSITVDRMARNFGVAQSMVALLLDHAAHRRIHRVRAAIAPSNHSSLALFSRTGFMPVPADERARVLDVWRRAGTTEDWCIYERTLRSATLRTLYAARQVPRWPSALVSGERSRA